MPSFLIYYKFKQLSDINDIKNCTEKVQFLQKVTMVENCMVWQLSLNIEEISWILSYGNNLAHVQRGKYTKTSWNKFNNQVIYSDYKMMIVHQFWAASFNHPWFKRWGGGASSGLLEQWVWQACEARQITLLCQKGYNSAHQRWMCSTCLYIIDTIFKSIW